MSAETENPVTSEDYSTVKKRRTALERLDLPMAAISRFLKSRELDVPSMNERFMDNVAQRLDEDSCKELVREHKYAGRQTINYFIVRGISDCSLDEIAGNALERFPSQEEVGQVTKEPFLADTDQWENRLYLPIGFNINAGSTDPITGRKTGVTILDRVVIVISEETDLIEVRGSDERMAEVARDELCRAIGKFQDSVKRRPPLGPDFQERFNELVERYYNLRVKVNDQQDAALEQIKFTSAQDDEGNRQDARDSKRVDRELSASGSEITMGYVELDEGFKFRINREMSKLTFMKSEREENLNQVTDLIDDVLREANEYSQRQLSGVTDVPE